MRMRGFESRENVGTDRGEPYTEAGSWQIAAGSSDVSRSQLVEWSTRGAKSKAQSGKRRRQRAAGSSVPSAECGVRNAE
jgi:hypothetical protein